METKKTSEKYAFVIHTREGNRFKQYIIVQFISMDRLKITEQKRRKLI